MLVRVVLIRVLIQQIGMEFNLLRRSEAVNAKQSDDNRRDYNRPPIELFRFAFVLILKRVIVGIDRGSET